MWLPFDNITANENIIFKNVFCSIVFIFFFFKISQKSLSGNALKLILFFSMVNAVVVVFGNSLFIENKQMTYVLFYSLLIMFVQAVLSSFLIWKKKSHTKKKLCYSQFDSTLTIFSYCHRYLRVFLKSSRAVAKVLGNFCLRVIKSHIEAKSSNLEIFSQFCGSTPPC